MVSHSLQKKTILFFNDTQRWGDKKKGTSLGITRIYTLKRGKKDWKLLCVCVFTLHRYFYWWPRNIPGDFFLKKEIEVDTFFFFFFNSSGHGWISGHKKTKCTVCWGLGFPSAFSIHFELFSFDGAAGDSPTCSGFAVHLLVVLDFVEESQLWSMVSL